MESCAVGNSDHHAVAALYTEFQREIDAMQVVFCQEKRQLDLLAEEIQEEVHLLAGRVCGIGNPMSSALPPPRQVSWCIENAAAMADYHSNFGESAREACLERGFRLQECPGVDFLLKFFPSGGESRSMTKHAISCRLVFEVSGAAANGLQLGISLSIRVVLAESRANVVPDDASVLSRMPRNIHVASAKHEARGETSLICEGILPLDLTDSNIFCDVEVIVRSWDPEVQTYATDWTAACQDFLDEDTEDEKV